MILPKHIKIKNKKGIPNKYIVVEIFQMQDVKLVLLQKINSESYYRYTTMVDDLHSGKFATGNTFMLAHFENEELVLKNTYEKFKSLYMINKILSQQIHYKISPYDLTTKERTQLYTIKN